MGIHKNMFNEEDKKLNMKTIQIDETTFSQIDKLDGIIQQTFIIEVLFKSNLTYSSLSLLYFIDMLLGLVILF